MNDTDIQKLFGMSPWNPEQAIKADDPALQPFLSFSDKDSYLAWRAAWKATYADLSQEIRNDRKAWRAEGNNHDTKTTHSLFSRRALARTMLSLRAASKVKAEELYQASKAQAEVA